MRKYQCFRTITQAQTPRGLLVVQDYFPSRATGDKKWREYVIHTAGIVGGDSFAFASQDARDAWVLAQGLPMQQSLFQ